MNTLGIIGSYDASTNASLAHLATEITKAQATRGVPTNLVGSSARKVAQPPAGKYLIEIVQVLRLVSDILGELRDIYTLYKSGAGAKETVARSA